jgi:RNA polymerase sigma-70 factor, ECF subfamily
MGSHGDHKPDLVELVDRHYAVVYRYAFRMTGSAADAEDVTQQAFMTAQRKLSQLREPEFARSWLIAIARNTYLKTLRSRPNEPHVSLDAVGDPAETAGETPVDGERLQAALNELPEEFRTPLILYYFNELSYKDVAQALDLPIGTVMSRLARGKAHLRRRLTTIDVDAVQEFSTVSERGE